MRVFSLLGLVALAGCGGGDDSGETGDALPTSACADFGVDGGELELGEATLRVPSGALDGEVELCLETGLVEAPADYTLLSEVYTVTPTVVTFAEEVTLALPLVDSAESVAGYSSIDGEAWSVQSAQPIGERAELSASRGGSYLIAEFARVESELVLADVDAQDVLFIVDDSLSMADEQARLAAAASTFIESIRGVDFHIGLVTTDMDNEARSGKLVPYAGDGDTILDMGDSDPVQRLEGLVQVGIEGSGDERGLDAAYSALHHRVDDESAGFLREGAGLTLIFVGDEGDQSLWVNSFKPFLSAYEPSPEVFGIMGLTTSTQGCDAARAYTVPELAAAYPGGMFDVCAESYEGAASSIGESIFLRGARQLVLDHAPQVESIEVSVVDGAQSVTALTAADWRYDADTTAVVLLAPAQGAERMRVSYVPFH